MSTTEIIILSVLIIGNIVWSIIEKGINNNDNSKKISNSTAAD